LVLKAFLLWHDLWNYSPVNQLPVKYQITKIHLMKQLMEIAQKETVKIYLGAIAFFGIITFICLFLAN
jgi:hypothetical protein